MAFEVIVPKPVEKKIKKLGEEYEEVFFKQTEKLERHPEKFGKPLRGALSGLWELYFEDSFRILYTIDKRDGKVYIREIRHKDDF